MPLSSVVGAQSIVKPGVCTSSTRPASPFEGQMIYETDTDVLAIWNGSAWRQLAAATKTGSVLQVVTATTTTVVATTGSTFSDTTLTATITPSSASNKIFVSINQTGYTDAAATGATFRLVRGSTTLQQQTDAVYGASSSVLGAVSFMYLDSPATTSAVTYKTTVGRVTGSGTAYSGVNNNPANITLMEIAG